MKSELLNVLGEVKARVQDKLGAADFPMPQFILIGKQSVGKSRLIESLAGECFNFISGTLGSRRPTVLEFRNVAKSETSTWYVRDRTTGQWAPQPLAMVEKIIGDAHEELGENVSEQAVYVRVESPHCVDMQIVDLPGFRDFALDAGKKELADKIHELVMTFMRDSQNVMLCVEQAGDASTMSTLAKCRELDPEFSRTVLIRNKLDKYYSDLTPDNINNWMAGFGDLPPTILKCTFALTLPWWKDGSPPPQSLAELTEQMNQQDIRELQAKGAEPKYMSFVGFKNFVNYMDARVEQMFAAAVNPVLDNLRDLKEKTEKKEKELKEEFVSTNPDQILNTTRDCGGAFAGALGFVMEGQAWLQEGRVTLETELRNFHEYHKALGSDHLMMLPSDDFADLDDYIDYLRNASFLEGLFDAPLSGGAQFRRLMMEVEIFLRFSEIAADTKKRDVIQARGISMTSLTWRDVVVKLLGEEAHVPLQRRVMYVGERIAWFFESQKNVIIELMSALEDGGETRKKMFPSHYPRCIKIIKANQMMKHLIFEAYDKAARRQLQAFVELFQNMLTSTFANPWAFLKGGTQSESSDVEGKREEPEFRIPKEIESRSGIEAMLSKWLQDIPTESHQIDEAVDKVQMLVLKIYSLIRSQVCDQVELFAESFFKLPMLRRLEEDMTNIELSDQDKANYESRRSKITQETTLQQDNYKEISQCLELLQNFKLQIEMKQRF